MEKACSLCYDLVLHNSPHQALKKISELKGSELYKCCCCYAYLHKHDDEWEIISGGDFNDSPERDPHSDELTSTRSAINKPKEDHSYQNK